MDEATRTHIDHEIDRRWAIAKDRTRAAFWQWLLAGFFGGVFGWIVAAWGVFGQIKESAQTAARQSAVEYVGGQVEQIDTDYAQLRKASIDLVSGIGESAQLAARRLGETMNQIEDFQGTIDATDERLLAQIEQADKTIRSARRRIAEVERLAGESEIRWDTVARDSEHAIQQVIPLLNEVFAVVDASEGPDQLQALKTMLELLDGSDADDLLLGIEPRNVDAHSAWVSSPFAPGRMVFSQNIATTSLAGDFPRTYTLEVPPAERPYLAFVTIDSKAITAEGVGNARLFLSGRGIGIDPIESALPSIAGAPILNQPLIDPAHASALLEGADDGSTFRLGQVVWYNDRGGDLLVQFPVVIAANSPIVLEIDVDPGIDTLRWSQLSIHIQSLGVVE